MKSAYTVSVRVPVTPNERTALAGVAQSLGLSTHAFARLLFAYAIADIRPIANYLRECRKRQAKAAVQGNSR